MAAKAQNAVHKLTLSPKRVGYAWAQDLSFDR
jgi:hypothetical protein